ncbi:leucine-rich repeat-containing protein [Tanacetum coccineum]
MPAIRVKAASCHACGGEVSLLLIWNELDQGDKVLKQDNSEVFERMSCVLVSGSRRKCSPPRYLILMLGNPFSLHIVCRFGRVTIVNNSPTKEWERVDVRSGHEWMIIGVGGGGGCVMLGVVDDVRVSRNVFRFEEGNKFSGILPWNLTKLLKLLLLDLQNSNIIGNLQEILPQIPSLEILILRNNSINGFIPSTISNFSALRILDLSGNNLTGSIPYEMANLQRMINTQEIASTTSHPTEPSAFSALDLLQDLFVNWKKSYQGLPSGNLDIYSLLDLSNNRISGEIPPVLGNLKALKVLNISNNMIFGHIPMSLGNLQAVESLDLSHNEISGSIPQTLDQLGNLTVLDVSFNMLTGKIPRGPKMDSMDDEWSYQNNSGLCGMQINIKCPEVIPSSEGRVEEEEDLSWIFWEGTWIGFPIGFFSTILIMSYLLKFIQLFKIW